MAHLETDNKLSMSLDDLMSAKGSNKRRAPDAEPPISTIKVARRIYVGNLAFKTSWQNLKDHFRTVGNVTHADVIRDQMTGRSKLHSDDADIGIQDLQDGKGVDCHNGCRGCGIVEFASSEEAAKAIEQLDESMLDERTIYVREDREDPDLKDHLGHNEAPRRKAQRTASNYGGRVPRIGSYMVGRPIESAAAVVGRRLYVQNLSFDVSWQDLKDHFRQAGNVVYADVLTDKASGSSKGCGIVEYEHPGDALRALARLSNTQLKGREIHVREDREELAQAPAGFDMYGGAPFDPGYSGSSHGFHSRGRAGGHYMGDRPSGYGDRGMRTMMPGRRQPPAAAPGCQVVVHGLPWSFSWQDLNDLLRPAGNIVHSDIMLDSSGRSKGYGTAIFETPRDAQNAIETLHGKELQGRVITLKLDKFAA